MSKVSLCLWFNGRAEAAAEHWIDVFRSAGQEASIGAITRYGDGMPMPKGEVLTVEIDLAGQPVMILNGGPHFALSPAVSLVVSCKDQAEVDHFWDRLLEGGGAPSRCGWLADRFGVSWQIVPAPFVALARSGDKGRVGQMMAAMMAMAKLDIAALQAAYDA